MFTTNQQVAALTDSGVASITRKLGALVVAVGIMLGASAMAQAGDGKLTVKAYSFNYLSPGTSIYTMEVATVPGGSCPKQTVGAAPEIVITTTNPSTGQPQQTYYEFLFWNINAKINTAQTVTFDPVCGEANSAYAWYLPICVATPADPDPCNGPPPTTDTVYAFSANKNMVIAGTSPIGSTSGGDWKPGSTTVTPPVTIEALHDITGFGVFQGWEILGVGESTLDTSASLSLKVPGEIVLGFFAYPDPDPCQIYRNEIAGGCSDIPEKACSTLEASWHKLLNMCATSNGENAF